MIEDWQARTTLLIGHDAIKHFAQLHVVVAGVGGVGGYVVEALARAGVGRLTLIDHDHVSTSNRNRQIVALTSTTNKPKVEVMTQRILEINPQCQVNYMMQVICDDASSLLQTLSPDVVVDAIDSVNCKVALLHACVSLAVPVYSSMGAGRRLDVTAVKMMDVMDTKGCGLARSVRHGLRKLGVGRGITCVVSSELCLPQNNVDHLPSQERVPNGTISYMPAIFGMMLAGQLLHHQIQMLILRR